MDAAAVDYTVNSGQVFLWEKIDGAWFGTDGGRIARISGEPAAADYSGGAERDLLRLDDDYDGIIREISADDAVRTAAAASPGLRVLRQDPFQCCISFIVSANSSIRKTRACLRRLCRMFGETIEFRGYEFRLFPEPRELARAPDADLRRCGLGYRAPFVKRAARAVLDGSLDFEALADSDYGDAWKALIGVPGVGGKVADCIMLFSLEKLDAFPLDRWTLRVLEKHHPGRPDRSSLTPRQYVELHERVAARFGRYAGYAQQFLFRAEREKSGAGW